MKPVNAHLGALSLALFLLAGTSDVMAERLEQASISDSPWTFEFYVDGWLPKAPATITIGDLYLSPSGLVFIIALQ